MQRRERGEATPRPAPTSWETDPERSRSPQPRRSLWEAAMGNLAGPTLVPPAPWTVTWAGAAGGRTGGPQGDTSDPAASRER